MSSDPKYTPGHYASHPMEGLKVPDETMVFDKRDLLERMPTRKPGDVRGWWDEANDAIVNLRTEVSAQSALIAELKDIITIKDDCIDTLNGHVAKRDALIRNLRNVLKQQRIWQPYGSWSTLTDAEIDALLAKVEQSNG